MWAPSIGSTLLSGRNAVRVCRHCPSPNRGVNQRLNNTWGYADSRRPSYGSRVVLPLILVDGALRSQPVEPRLPLPIVLVYASSNGRRPASDCLRLDGLPGCCTPRALCSIGCPLLARNRRVGPFAAAQSYLSSQSTEDMPQCCSYALSGPVALVLSIEPTS